MLSLARWVTISLLLAFTLLDFYMGYRENRGVAGAWMNGIYVVLFTWVPPTLVVAHKVMKLTNHPFVLGVTWVWIISMIFASVNYFQHHNSFIFLPSFLGLWIWAFCLLFIGRKNVKP